MGGKRDRAGGAWGKGKVGLGVEGLRGGMGCGLWHGLGDVQQASPYHSFALRLVGGVLRHVLASCVHCSMGGKLRCRHPCSCTPRLRWLAAWANYFGSILCGVRVYGSHILPWHRCWQRTCQPCNVPIVAVIGAGRCDHVVGRLLPYVLLCHVFLPILWTQEPETHLL